VTATAFLVVAAVFSFAVTRWVTRYAERYFVLSGAEYLIVGVLIGPFAPMHVLTQHALDALQPFVSLLVGLLGFLVGLRSPQRLRAGPASTVGVLSATGVLVVVAAASLLALDLLRVPPLADSQRLYWEVTRGAGWVLAVDTYDTHLWLALALGSAAVVAGSLVIRRTREQLGSAGNVGELLIAFADTSQWVAIISFGLVLALARGTSHDIVDGAGATEWALAALALGSLCGVLFSLFIGRDTEPQRVFLAGIGVVIFASGIGTALGVSPLFVNWILGLTVALTSTHAALVAQAMDRMQHPLYVLIMIFAGAMWRPVDGLIWLLPVVYVAVRYASRLLFVPLFARALLEVPPVTLANGLWSQGTLAVAIAVNFSQRYAELSRVALSTVLLGVLLSELFSHRLLRALLVDSGEVRDGPQVREEPA
jgi:hypothetical protein